MNGNHRSLERVSVAELYDVITAASSQDPSRVHVATTRLKEMLILGGTYDALQEIAAQKSLPLSVRQQSMIQFKNVVASHWRSRKLLSDDERCKIKARTFMFIDESDNVIAECNESCIAKIARHDFPANWPSLADDLMGFVDTSLQVLYNSSDQIEQATLILRRSLRVVGAVLKELAPVKLSVGVRNMKELVEKIHLKLSAHYTKLTASFSSLDPSSVASPRCTDNILLAHLTYKSIVKMAVWIWHQSDKPGRDLDNLMPWFFDVFQNTIVQAKTLTELRTNLIIAVSSLVAPVDNNTRRSLDQLSRHVHLFCKFFRRLQKDRISRFVALPMSSDLVLFYWNIVNRATSGPPACIADSNEAIYPVRFLVQALVLFKENLGQWTPKRKDGTPNPNSLSREFVENAVRLLVTRLIPLRNSDLESWVSDPEEWVNIEEKDDEQWEFQLRPCSERVLMTLANHFESFVAPLLAATFDHVMAQPVTDLPAVIQKEAMYCVIGRCALHLKDVIPFEAWLSHSLASEIRETNASYPIVKRRIAWLIGKWISNMCTSVNNPAIWEILVHLLHDRGLGTDAVVRFTAATAVKMCVDNIEFNVNIFTPYLTVVVSSLVQLIAEADTTDGKLRIVHCLDTVIEHTGRNILPLAQEITKPLPELWTLANEDWLFKASLLTVMNHLVKATHEQSGHLVNVVIPLIRESLSPGTISHLDTDGLSLWLIALRNSNGIQRFGDGPTLVDLFPLCFPLLANHHDVLGNIVDIVRSYLILDADHILRLYGTDLIGTFVTVLDGSMKPMSINIKDVIVSVNLLTQLTSATLWGEIFHTSGLFAHVLRTLSEDKEPNWVLAEYLHVLARIAIADPQVFLRLMGVTAASQNISEPVMYNCVLDRWWNTFDSMSEHRHRKLAAMGMAALVSTGRSEILLRLPFEIFNLWTDVFAEIREVQDVPADDSTDIQSSPRSIKRYWEQDEPPLSYFQGTEGTLEYQRRKEIYENDPVRTTLLREYVRRRLQEAEIAAGGTEIFQSLYLAQADPLLLKEIQGELFRA